MCYCYSYSETSNKGHYESGQTSQQRTSQKCTLCRKSPLKEDNLSTKDKTAGPEGVLIKMFYCIGLNAIAKLIRA